MKAHQKSSIAIAITLIISTAIYGFYSLKKETLIEQQRFRNKIKRNNFIIKEVLTSTIWDLDKDQIIKNLNFFMQDEEIVSIVLRGNFETYKKEKEQFTRVRRDIKQSITLVKQNKHILGHLEIKYNNSVQLQNINKIKSEIFEGTVLLLFILMLFNYYILNFLNAPLRKLSIGLKKIEKGDLNYLLPTNTNDEYRSIFLQFNKMVKELNKDRIILRQNQKEIKKARNDAILNADKLKDLNIELEKIIEKRTVELKKAKLQAEKANEAKSKFLANISHEMRTPLTPIIGFSKVLKRKDISINIIKKLEVIHQSGEKLLKLTNQLLDISKIEKNQSNLTNIIFNIDDTARDVFEENQLSARDKKLDFSYSLDNCSNKSFYSDGLKIYQIINNLVNNAIKYTEAGFVFFEIQNKDKYLFIDVFDSGMGISTENLKIIFEPFEQVDNQKNGFGLGLNIIKNYIESLKGKLEVISHLGKGSHFKVKIPIFQTSNLNLMENLEKVWLKNLEGERRKITLKAIIRLPKKIKALKEAVDNKDILNAKKINHMILGVSGNFKFDEIYQLSKKIAENLNFDLGNTELELNSMKQIINSLDYRQIFGSLIESEGRKYRILLADDTAENRELVREMLKIKCIELKSVDNGQKVLEILEKEYFDLILLDIQMPVLNGIEVLKAMKEKNKDIPVISLTAEAIKGCRKKHLSLGFKEYISKPIDEVEFYNKIEEILHYEDFSC